MILRSSSILNSGIVGILHISNNVDVVLSISVYFFCLSLISHISISCTLHFSVHCLSYKICFWVNFCAEFVQHAHFAKTKGVMMLAFTCAVVVQDLCEDGRVTVKEVLAKYSVIVGLGLSESSQSRSGNLSECGTVDIMPHSTHVDAHPATCHRNVKSWEKLADYIFNSFQFVSASPTLVGNIQCDCNISCNCKICRCYRIWVLCFAYSCAALIRVCRCLTEPVSAVGRTPNTQPP